MSKLHICKYCKSVLTKVTDPYKAASHPWYCLVCSGYPDNKEVQKYEFVNAQIFGTRQQDLFREKLKQHLAIWNDRHNDFTGYPVKALLEAAPVGTVIEVDYVGSSDPDRYPFTGHTLIRKLDPQSWEYHDQNNISDGKTGGHGFAAWALDIACNASRMKKLTVKFAK